MDWMTNAIEVIKTWPAPILATVVFVGAVAYDWTYLIYFESYLKRRSVAVANWGFIMIFIGTVETIAYTSTRWLVWPLWAGYWVGAFTCTEYLKRKEKQSTNVRSSNVT